MIKALQDLDQIITLWVNRSAQWPMVHTGMELLSQNSTWIMTGLSFFLFLSFRNRRLALFLGLTVLLGIGITDATCTYLLKPFFERLRPCHSLVPAIRAAGCGGLYSFPSNHAANGMTVALLLWRFLGNRIGAASLFLVCLVGLSRVHLGAHFVGDILFGFLVGVLISTTLWKSMQPLTCRVTPLRQHEG